MDTSPLWLADPGPAYPALQGDVETDGLVIGGGITGVTAAHLLKQSGLRVVLLDRRAVGDGESGHTTAHLTKVTDLRLSDLVRDFGRDHAQAVWDAGQYAVEEIAARVRDERIDCGFRRVPGFLYAAPQEDGKMEIEDLHREAHLAAELGFDADFVECAPVVGRPAIRYPNQAEFHPIRYVRALASRITGEGSHVYEHSEAAHFTDERHVTVNGFTVRYEHCVVATHVPLQASSGTLSAMLLQTKLAAYSTYAVGGVLPRRRYPRALFWDTNDPYLYIRIQEGEQADYVIIGGCDHKTGQGAAEESYGRLLETARAMFPDAVFDRRWSGQVIETADGLPYIGEIKAGQFLATGFAGNGMTFGTLSGLMACDWVQGAANPWRDLFSPHRKSLSGAWDYLRENKDYPFYLAKRLLAGADTAAVEDVPPGEGRIVRLDGGKAAVHRLEDGTGCVRSAVCPHLGCLVAWNASEKTWDCPCHGSRFQATGEVISGPAEAPLAPFDRS